MYEKIDDRSRRGDEHGNSDDCDVHDGGCSMGMGRMVGSRHWWLRGRRDYRKRGGKAVRVWLWLPNLLRLSELLQLRLLCTAALLPSPLRAAVLPLLGAARIEATRERRIVAT